MKKMFKCMLPLLLCLALLLGTVPAQAAGYDFAVVTNSATLNLRSGPGTEYDRLYTASRGDWVMLLGESGNWYYVQVMSNGKTGYIFSKYLRSRTATYTLTGHITFLVHTYPT